MATTQAGRMVYRFPVAVVFGVASAVSLAAFARNPASIAPSCPFDGGYYCAAAGGHRIPAPFSRRPVVPLVARLLPGTLDARFRALSVLSLLLVIVLAIVLGDRIVTALDPDRRARIAVAVIIAGVGIVGPHGLRLALSVPVLIDHAGLAAGLLWIVLYTSRPRAALMLAVPAAVLACCTREIWGPVIVLTVLSTLFVRRKVVGFAIASAVAALVSFVAVTRFIPSAPSSYDELDLVKFVWHIHFADIEGARQVVWGYVFAVGLLPAVLLYRPPLRWFRRSRAEGDTTALTVLIAGILLVGSALLAGTDLTRLAYPGGYLLIIVSAPWLVSQRDLAIPATILAITTVVLWKPGRHLITSVPDYLAYYYPQARATRGLAISAIALGVAGVVLLLDRRVVHR